MRSRSYGGSWKRALLGVCVTLVMVAASARTTGAQATAVVGIVLDSAGAPVMGAEVTVEGSLNRVLTDERGAFRLGQLAPGDANLRIRRLGFQPASRVVSVAAGREARADFRLFPLAIRLPAVQVRRLPTATDSRLAGFNARRTRRVGHFVTRERLDRMASFRLIDALREIPGIQMRVLRGGVNTVVIRGASCFPLVFLDGFPATAGTLDLDMIDLASVEGIEVYAGLASVPPEFVSVRGGERCGVIAIWSRPARPNPNRRLATATADLPKLLADQRVLTADQVTEPAMLRAGTASPVYPESLWKAGVRGHVVVEFVVDVRGQIEAGTLGIVSTTHALFTAAVESALASATFRAARLSGRPVRQIVQLPFVFEPVSAPLTDSTRPSS